MNVEFDIDKLHKECIKNARRLYDKSVGEYDEKNWPLSTTLAITSYEESLKANLVTTLKYGYISKQKFIKIWYRHDLKLLSKYARIRISEDEKTGEIKQEYTLPDQIDKGEIDEVLLARNNSLYVDFKNEKIYTPTEIIKPTTAHKFLKMARRKLEWEEMFLEIIEELKIDGQQNVLQ